MEMMYYQLGRSSYQDSLNLIEADIQYANALAAAIPRAKGGARLHMKYLNLLHIVIYKVYGDRKIDLCSYGRKATIRNFYAVILPSLQRLYNNVGDLDCTEEKRIGKGNLSSMMVDGDIRQSNADMEREDECGICLEPCTKMVLPDCCHAMCIKCYRNWNVKSVSCPFCRGSLKRVNSEDLWVLTCKDEVADPETISREDLLRFYLYINSLPKDYPDSLFSVYYEYLI